MGDFIQADRAMTDDKVVRAFPGTDLPENPLQIESRDKNAPMWCGHENVRLNEHDRLVICAKCSATLDPFNFLLKNAQTIQRAYESHRQVSKMVSDLNDRVSELKKEEGRIKSRIKRLNEKSGDVVLSVRDRLL